MTIYPKISCVNIINTIDNPIAQNKKMQDLITTGMAVGILINDSNHYLNSKSLKRSSKNQLPMTCHCQYSFAD